jgi:D-citramalate synthase
MGQKYPDLWFDFHAHNDYDLAVANVYSAIKAGVKGIHTTVNGLGERAGNAPLSSVVGLINDQLKESTNVDETKINKVSTLVETFSGIRIPVNKPIIGENLLPERFGRKRKYALGKLSGKANILKNLQELGLNLGQESLKKVTQRVIELGDKKENVTTEDLPYIISDVLENGSKEKSIIIKNYSLSLSSGMKPLASVQIQIDDKIYKETSLGDGQYDAFMQAVWKIYGRLKKDRPVLKDYKVTIPPGGKTDALVDTKITWKFKDKEFVTRGLDADQTEAAIKATEKILNMIENE